MVHRSDGSLDQRHPLQQAQAQAQAQAHGPDPDEAYVIVTTPKETNDPHATTNNTALSNRFTGSGYGFGFGSGLMAREDSIVSSTVFTEVAPTSASVGFPFFPQPCGKNNRNGQPQPQEDQILEQQELESSHHRYLPRVTPFAMAAGQAVPHVSIQETQKYTFAMVLKHPEQVFDLLRKRFPTKSAYVSRHNLYQQVSELQQKCIRRLVQAGLGVVLLDNERVTTTIEKTSNSKSRDRGRDGEHDADEDGEDDVTHDFVMQNICVLIDPKHDPELLVDEFQREMDELAIQQGKAIERLGEETLDSIRQNMCFSPALELQLTHNIIENALKDYDKEEWVVDVNKELTVKDMLLEVFPLHDRQFNKKFFKEYRKNTFDFKLRKTTTGNCERWAIEELRLHFGERVAFLFAFMHIYTKLLTPMACICVVFYLFLRFWPGFFWREYMQGLAIIGFCVACIWAPSFLVYWQRETSLLTEKWNLAKYKNTVYEKNDYNPDFQYVWVKNDITNEMEKVRKMRNSYLLQITMLFYVLLSALIQCVCLLPFIQWYVYAKNAPTCDDCHELHARERRSTYECMWFVTCFNSKTSAFGSDRWVYILIQGVLLGLLIDIIFFEIFNWVSEKFVKWENYQKKSEREDRLIHRRFVFVWSNWFFWFLFLAFVYLPFGDKFLRYFHKVSALKALAPYKFEPEKLNLDTMFVTPLVVTQLLNMILETVVPYVMRRLRGRPTRCCQFATVKEWFRHKTASICRVHAAHEQDRKKHRLTPRKLAALVKTLTGHRVDVMHAGDDSNHYTANEIVGESKLPVFDTVFDYLDATIQFSYVVMFTVVWPLLPLPALINNVLEVRGDAFRLLFGQRRPMPRRDTSIGEWFTVLGYANIIGITVVGAFLVMYHMGYFLTSCDFSAAKGPMVPFNQIHPEESQNPERCRADYERFSYSLWEAAMFIILEHFGFCVRYLVLQIRSVPSVIRSTAYTRIKQIAMLTAAQRIADSSQFEYIRELRELFEQYDTEQDGHLREQQLIPFLAQWVLKHPSELLPYSSILFRYMDKPQLGKISFATCCLMLQRVNHDRFLASLLGIYDPSHGTALNQNIYAATDAIELRRVLSVASSTHASEYMERSVPPPSLLHLQEEQQQHATDHDNEVLRHRILSASLGAQAGTK